MSRPQTTDAAKPETSPKTSDGLTHLMASWVNTCLLAFLVSCGLAILIQPLAVLGLVGLILVPLGLFSAVFGLLGAMEASTRDLANCVVGFVLNGILLFGIVTSDFLVFHHAHHAASPRAACVANLKQMDGAKATWALEQHKATNDIPADSDLFGNEAYIRMKPQCPEGGTYIIGKVAEKTRCSVGGHTL